MTRRLVSALTGALAISLTASTLLVGAPAQAQLPPEDRPSTPPNVMFPVIAKHAKDLRTSGRRPGTEIKARCGRPVRAAHPGTAVVTSSKTSGPALVRVVTSNGRLTSWYGFMSSAAVTTGQILQAGQRIGVVGRTGSARMCSLYFAVTSNNGAKTFNPSRWLNRRVGKPLKVADLFNNRGFVVASFNVLGASHTRNSSRYAPASVRTPKQAALLNSYGADVVGLQEFQNANRNSFLASTGSTWATYPTEEMVAANPKTDVENSIIWRRSTMEFLEGHTIDVPYFNGMSRPRKMPVVLLRHKATGRTAYFINVHNPASGVGYGDQTANRRQAIAIERAEVIRLRATGRPVFLTGDFNDRKPAFCGLTTGMLMITPDSIPSTTCAPPAKLHIDWVFAAGPARFTRYARDWKPKDLRLTDHPIVWTRAHMSE